MEHMMDSFSAKAYLAQVFDDRVKDSLTTIKNVCEALDVTPTWIDGASSSPPAEEAKDLISGTDFLIAFCTRKDKLEGCNEYHTSNAVREEIAIAKAQDKQVICFLENGVRADGFTGSRSTYSFLENAEKLTPKDIKDIVRSLHKTKLKSIKTAPEIVHATGVNNYSVISLDMEIELINDTSRGAYWNYTIERIFEFEADHDQPLTHSAFCLEGIPNAVQPTYSLEFLKNQEAVETSLDVRELPNGVDIKSSFNPAPKKGDIIFVREQYKSPHLNPIFSEQNVGTKLSIGDHILDAYDGLCVISRVKELIIRYKFPKSYKVKNLQPLVMTFSNALDHANKDEIARLIEEKSVSIREFNNSISAELCVKRPLYQYFYGMGWGTPSSKSTDFSKISESAPTFID
jgi:hypothetical protein